MQVRSDQVKTLKEQKSQIETDDQKLDEELFRRNIEILTELGYSKFEAEHTLKFVDNEVYIAMQLLKKKHTSSLNDDLETDSVIDMKNPDDLEKIERASRMETVCLKGKLKVMQQQLYLLLKVIFMEQLMN